MDVGELIDQTGADELYSPRTQPLLALCGLCGGAGASTLAYLLARAAADEEGLPVLACDTGGPGAGLATYAGRRSPRSLAGVADAIAAGEPLDGDLFAQDQRGLRLIARGPDLDAVGEPLGLARLLSDARATHALTVVDCGTLARPLDRELLGAASHIVWVLPASPSGVARGRRLLELLPPPRYGRELVVARHDPDGRADTAQLAALADERGGPLVLVPQLPDLAAGDVDAAVELAGVALTAILGFLRR
jgi:Flp pilus assembly CpaE family ATPase